MFIEENLFENVVWKMAVILSRPQCVKGPHYFGQNGHTPSTWYSLSSIQIQIELPGTKMATLDRLIYE